MERFKYKIFPEKRLIVKYYRGETSFKELIECINTTGQDKLYDPNYDVINDFRDSVSGMKIKEINEIFGYVKGHKVLYGKRKSVLLAKTPNQTVFSMISGLIKRESLVKIKSFSTLEESIKWLGLPYSDTAIIESCINEFKID
jgi:hypothetical protein